jgi:hypothetical protein
VAVKAFQYRPGLPAAGHITAAGGYWHPGGIDTCRKCFTPNIMASPQEPTRGANLMSNTITETGEPVLDPENSCQGEFHFRDFDGTRTSQPCGQPVTHRPVVDDAYSLHLRTAGETSEEVQPQKLPLCDHHYEELVVEIAGQEFDDPHRVWIRAEPVTILVGYTKAIIPEGDEEGPALYVPYVDGWRPGAEQHVLSLTVDLPPTLETHQVADLVFYATNAPDLADDPWAGAIRKAIDATGYRGEEAGHFSLSVGDTVTVDGIGLACKSAAWGSIEEAGR